MKFVKRIPKTDRELSAFFVATGWKKIKEPSNLIYSLLYSIPFMVVNSIIAYLFIRPFYNPLAQVLQVIESSSISFVINIYTFVYIIGIYILIVIHELIHALFIPDFLRSNETYWGLTIYGGFVCTTQKLTKGKFILITIAPFVILSIIMPLIFGILGIKNEFLFFLLILNALASSIDILNMILILFQAPQKSIILNNGFETYYQELP
jgi:hypothetical protein